MAPRPASTALLAAVLFSGVLAASWGVQAAPDTPDPQPVPRFVIDLDKPPEDRWQPVLDARAASIRLIADIVLADFNLSPSRRNITAAMLAAVGPRLPAEYRAEMQSVADAVNLTFSDVLTVNLFYELSGLMPLVAGSKLPSSGAPHATFCTSIVAQRANGSVYHARNQDYPFVLRPYVIHIDYERSGVPQYTATSFDGYVGIGGSAMARFAEGWSYSVNARDDPDTDAAHKLATVLAAANAGAWIAPLVARNAMDQGMVYADAHKALATTPLMQPVYFIIAGTKPGEGSVISRNRTVAANVLSLGTAQQGGQDWYVLQTNDDNWKPPADKRRAAGLASMNAVGSAVVNTTSLWNVLDKSPVFNFNTIHTETIAPAWFEYNTYLRYFPL